MRKWFKSLCEHGKDKKLAAQCNLDAKAVCVHEFVPFKIDLSSKTLLEKCIKCEELYR